METNRIIQFRTVFETGNLRKAAEILHISHSGLSKSMKALESELGFSLFYPSGRGIVPSDRARRLYERSKAFLGAVDDLMGHTHSFESEVLRIGSFETFTSFFMGPLLKQHLPTREIEIHELIPGRLEEALAFNKLDLGITYEPIPRRGIDYSKITSISMGAFARESAFSDRPFSQIPFIIPVSPLEGAPSGVKGLDSWPDDKLERTIRYRVDLLATGLELARQGLGAIYIPRFVARLHNERVRERYQLQPIHLPAKMTSLRRNVFLLRRESTPINDDFRSIVRALKEICADHSAVS